MPVYCLYSREKDTIIYRGSLHTLRFIFSLGIAVVVCIFVWHVNEQLEQDDRIPMENRSGF